MTSLDKNVEAVKKILSSEDVLVFEFISDGGKKFAAVYCDDICDKNMLGELAIKPLRDVAKEDGFDKVRMLLASPEFKESDKIKEAVKEISNGNAVVFIDGEKKFCILGFKKPPARAITEPPTQIAVRGPREGFVEDIKINSGLVRKRIKTPALQIKMIQSGKRSDTNIAIVYIEGVCPKGLPERIEKEIAENTIDIIPDSSYVSSFVSKRPRSVFKRCATAEKPDIFCAKVCEGRVGILVDGSPLAITVPYMIVEDFQTSEDYYSSSYRATVLRIIRAVSVLIGMFLPAIYVSAQLFKIQLIPFRLLLKISSSVQGIPLSPSIEMFLTLFVLEVLNEASIRMPKYVGLALSVVGALVLGDTAVKAGVISTPAIIIIAFSAICLYTVPDFAETTTILRWIFLIVAGSIGPFGVVTLAAFIIGYLVSENSYGTPLMAPFAPLVKGDLYDSIVKANMYSLKNRPQTFRLKNKVRFKSENKR